MIAKVNWIRLHAIIIMVKSGLVPLAGDALPEDVKGELNPDRKLDPKGILMVLGRFKPGKSLDVEVDLESIVKILPEKNQT